MFVLIRPAQTFYERIMVGFHTGYELHDSDFKDVSALCERFGIDYPEEYAHLKKPDL